MKTPLLCLSFLIAFNTHAKEPNFNKKSPIDIESATLTVDQESNKAIFEGNVIAKQEQYTLYSDKLEIIYSANKKEEEKISQENMKDFSNKIELINAIGNVKFEAPDKNATSNNATYNINTNILEMSGKVKLIQNGSILYGEKLVYNLKQNKANIIGNKENNTRVKVIINNDKK